MYEQLEVWPRRVPNIQKRTGILSLTDNWSQLLWNIQFHLIFYSQMANKKCLILLNQNKIFHFPSPVSSRWGNILIFKAKLKCARWLLSQERCIGGKMTHYLVVSGQTKAPFWCMRNMWRSPCSFVRVPLLRNCSWETHSQIWFRYMLIWY